MKPVPIAIGMLLSASVASHSCTPGNSIQQFCLNLDLGGLID